MLPGRRFVHTDTTTTILMLAHHMAITDLTILSTEFSSAWVRGITGAIQPGSGIAAGTVAVGTMTAGMGTAVGIIADTITDTNAVNTAGAMLVPTPMATVDSVGDKVSAGAKPMAAATSMVEADSTAADGGKSHFC